jgi:hypothetical protein
VLHKNSIMSKVIKDRILSHEKNDKLIDLHVNVESANLPHVVISHNSNGVKFTLELDQDRSSAFIAESAILHGLAKGEFDLQSCHAAIALKFCSEYKFGENLLPEIFDN